MKKVLFLLVALLGTVGMANAAVEFKYTSTYDVTDANTIHVNTSAGALSEVFTIKLNGDAASLGTGSATLVTTGGLAVTDDGTPTGTAITPTVNPVAGGFQVSFDAPIPEVYAGQNVLLRLPTGFFTCGTETSTEMGLFVSIAKSTKTISLPSKTFVVTQTYDTRDFIDYAFTTNATAIGVNGTAHPYYKPEGKFAIKVADYKNRGVGPYYIVIPGNTYYVEEDNKSRTYFGGCTITISVEVQSLNLIVDDIDNIDKTIYFHFTDNTAGGSPKPSVNNIERAEIANVQIGDKTWPTNKIGLANLPGNPNKIYTVKVDEADNTSLYKFGKYDAKVTFVNDFSMTLTGGDKDIAASYGILVVNQVWKGDLNAKISTELTLEGEDINAKVDELVITHIPEVAAGALKLVNVDYAHGSEIVLSNTPHTHDLYNSPTSTPVDYTFHAPTVPDATKLSTTSAIKGLTYADGKYTIELETLLPSGTGYLVTFPANSLCAMGSDEIMHYNGEPVSVKLNVLHAFEFFDTDNTHTPLVDNDNTTPTEVNAKADMYDVIHYYRTMNANQVAPWVAPFNVTADDAAAAGLTLKKITAVTNDEGDYNIHVRTLTGTETALAYMPYIVVSNTSNVKLNVKNALMSASPASPKAVKSSTTDGAVFEFTATYDGTFVDMTNTAIVVTDVTDPDKDVLYLQGQNGQVTSIAGSGVLTPKNIYGNIVGIGEMHDWRLFIKVTNMDSVNYAKFNVVEEDETTAIESVATESENGAMFNVAGQRISAPVKGQVYMMNGKKYIAK